MLFIGGIADGRHIDVYNDRKFINIPEDLSCMRRSLYAPPTNEEIEDINIRYDTYERMPLCGNSRRFHVMALEGMTADDVIRALICGHKRKKR